MNLVLDVNIVSIYSHKTKCSVPHRANLTLPLPRFRGTLSPSPDTYYLLHAVQPNSSVLTPIALGSFRTRSYIVDLYPDMTHIGSLSGSEHTGTFYMKKGQFFVLVSLFGQSVGDDSFNSFSLIFTNNLTIISGNLNISVHSLIWDPKFDGRSKPFPFFYALILPADMMPDPPSVVEFHTDIIFTLHQNWIQDV